MVAPLGNALAGYIEGTPFDDQLHYKNPYQSLQGAFSTLVPLNCSSSYLSPSPHPITLQFDS